jgi:hypothetical protein
MKNKQYWAENCNLTGLAESFSQMFFQNMGRQFEGNINILIFDRKLKNQIDNCTSHLPSLDGWLPYKDNTQSPYDFILTPDMAVSKELIHYCLKQIDPTTYSVITLNITKTLGTMVVALVM